MTYTTAELNQTGIYAIINRDTGKAYIGSSSRSFKQRWTQHKRSLRKGKHHSILLQRAWNKYTEFRFEFRILEVVPKEECNDSKYLLDVEQMYLDTYQPEYNICKEAGSTLGFKHTSDAIEKMSLKQKELAEQRRIKGTNTRVRKKPLKPIKPPLTEQEKLANKLRGLAKHNHTLKKKYSWKSYTINSPDGEVYKTTKLEEFCLGHDLIASGLRRVLKGEIEHYKEWRIRYSG